MKVRKFKIDPNCEEAKRKLEECSTVLLTMDVRLVDHGGLGLSFHCEEATVDAFDMFMPYGWLLRFMEEISDAISINKKMCKLKAKGTAEIVANFDRVRPDLKMKEDEASVGQQGD